MRSLGRCLTLAVAALPLLVVPTTGVAEAAALPCATGRPEEAIGDRRDQALRGHDATAVGVWNKDGNACVWTTVAGRFTAGKAQVVQVLYDTNGRGGAEFYAFAYSPRDGDERRGTFLVGRRNGEWAYLECDVSTFWRIGKGQIGLGVPQACLGDPARVRVKLQVWDIKEYRPRNTWRGRADQVPNRAWAPAV